MWWYLLWWLVICNGVCAACAATINRLDGYPLPDWTIPYTHKIHGALLLLTAGLALLGCAFLGSRLSYGSDWTELVPLWKLAGAACTVSTLLFWVGVARHQLRPTPLQQVRFESHRLDIAAEAGIPLNGPGPYAWMTHLPGNQVFQLQIDERELRIPRLPAAWDGLSILHFTDVHFIGTVKRFYFERVLEQAQKLSPDLICFTGDLLDDLELLSWLPSTLGRMQAPAGRLYVLGNHDQHLGMEAIRAGLNGLGWTDVAAQACQLERDGQILHVAGSEYPWVKSQPSFDTVPDAAFRILLSHTPDNLPAARQAQVDLMLSGHVHGGQIRLPVIGPLYCPSRFGCQYAEGLFWESPTLLHVGRGLAGRQPLRWGCPPEITRLVLRCAPASSPHRPR